MKMISFFRTIKDDGPLIWLTVATPFAFLPAAIFSVAESIGPELTTSDGSHRIVSPDGVEQIVSESEGILFDFAEANIYALTHTRTEAEGPFETSSIITSSELLSDFSTYSTPQEIEEAIDAGCEQAKEIMSHNPEGNLVYSVLPGGFDRKFRTASTFLENNCL
ncbi:MAG: hypothetical protein AAF549_08805 [Pseudomonadota bacterium]